jgi:predicted alpha/beta superfamily hydrolase
MLKIAMALALACALLSRPVCAELLAPKHDAIDSQVLAQKRMIEVYLPKETEKDAAQKFETLYVLDGDWNAKIVAETVDFLESVGFMPPVIVVSVPNFFDDKGVNSRDHDLTPTVVAGQARSGGAANFLSFLKNELVPYVTAHYPSSGVNLIHGHSYGGLFLVYTIMNDPTVFDGYLILDPAMRWDNYRISKVLYEKIAATTTHGKAIYIAGRSGAAFKGMGVDSLQEIFEKKAPKELHWKLFAYPNETHDSLKFKATFDALKFMYRGYDAQQRNVDPTEGIVEKDHPLTLQANTDRFDIYFTTDGSEPTAESQKMDQLLAVSNPETMRIKEISARGQYDREFALHLKYGDALLPVRAAKGNEKKEYRFAYYAPEAWPMFHTTPFEKGRAADVDMKHIHRESFSGIVERDYVVPADGYYAFEFGSSDKATLTVSGKKLIDIDGSEGCQHRVYAVPLRAGIYPVRVNFIRTSKNSMLDFHFHQFKDDGTGWESELQ